MQPVGLKAHRALIVLGSQAALGDLDAGAVWNFLKLGVSIVPADVPSEFRFCGQRLAEIIMIGWSKSTKGCDERSGVRK